MLSGKATLQNSTAGWRSFPPSSFRVEPVSIVLDNDKQFIRTYLPISWWLSFEVSPKWA